MTVLEFMVISKVTMRSISMSYYLELGYRLICRNPCRPYRSYRLLSVLRALDVNDLIVENNT